MTSSVGSDLDRFGSGSDWVQIGFRSGSDRVRIGFGSGSDRVWIGFGSCSNRPRIGIDLVRLEGDACCSAHCK